MYFHEECPVKTMSLYDSEEMKHPVPELAIVPVAMCRDPFRQGRHKIVLCTPAYINQPDKRVGKLQSEVQYKK